jgi:hypothetical protein
VAASSYATNPQFGSGGASDTHDIAVVLLAQVPAGITPARLPTAGLLDQLKAAHELDDQTFTAVGYGTVRVDHHHRRRVVPSTDKTYRLDTASARDFLDDFVTLP